MAKLESARGEERLGEHLDRKKAEGYEPVYGPHAFLSGVRLVMGGQVACCLRVCWCTDMRVCLSLFLSLLASLFRERVQFLKCLISS